MIPVKTYPIHEILEAAVSHAYLDDMDEFVPIVDTLRCLNHHNFILRDSVNFSSFNAGAVPDLLTFYHQDLAQPGTTEEFTYNHPETIHLNYIPALNELQIVMGSHPINDDDALVIQLPGADQIIADWKEFDTLSVLSTILSLIEHDGEDEDFDELMDTLESMRPLTPELREKIFNIIAYIPEEDIDDNESGEGTPL